MKLSVVVSLLVTVTVFAADVLPTATLPNARLAGARVSGVTPDPLRLTICGELAAESTTVTAPVMVPTLVGSNVTLTMQLAPAPSDPPQVLVSAKSPLPVMETLADALPVLVKVKLLAALVVATAWFANVRLDGTAVIATAVCETKNGIAADTEQGEPLGKFCTKIWNAVGKAMSLAVTTTCSVVEFTNVELRKVLFTHTCVPEVKPVPVIVKVKLPPPAAADGGLRLIIEIGVLVVL